MCCQMRTLKVPGSILASDNLLSSSNYIGFIDIDGNRSLSLNSSLLQKLNKSIIQRQANHGPSVQPSSSRMLGIKYIILSCLYNRTFIFLLYRLLSHYEFLTQIFLVATVHFQKTTQKNVKLLLLPLCRFLSLQVVAKHYKSLLKNLMASFLV